MRIGRRCGDLRKGVPSPLACPVMPYHGARKPRGWLAPAVLAVVVVFVIIKRQQLLNSSLGPSPAADGPLSAPRAEWTSAELGVFPHHISGEVRGQPHCRGFAPSAWMLSVRAVHSADTRRSCTNTPLCTRNRDSHAALRARSSVPKCRLQASDGSRVA